jgi:hypothetical protein
MGKEQELVQSIRSNDVESFRKIIAKFKSKTSKFSTVKCERIFLTFARDIKT